MVRYNEDIEDEYKNLVKKIIKYTIFSVIAVIFLFGTFYTIDTGHRGIVKTFGAPSMDAKGEGLHLKIPIAQRVVRMSVQTMKYEAKASAASKDLQIVETDVAVNYHIEPSTTPLVYQTIGVDYESKIIQPAVQESVKAVTAQFTAEELITKRDVVKEMIDQKLHERLAASNINMETTSITNFDFSDNFNAAIESKVTAEQLKLKAVNDLARIKVEAEQVEATAIGVKNAKIAEAEGNAEAIRLIDEQLRKSPLYIDYFTIQKWDGKLSLVSGGGMPLISLGNISGGI